MTKMPWISWKAQTQLSSLFIDSMTRRCRWPCKNCRHGRCGQEFGNLFWEGSAGAKLNGRLSLLLNERVSEPVHTYRIIWACLKIIKHIVITQYLWLIISFICGALMATWDSRQQSLWVKVEDLQNPQQKTYKDRKSCAKVYIKTPLGVLWFDE